VRNHLIRPLRHRAVRLLWTAAVFSDIGTWVQLIVVGSLVAASTGSAIQTGLVALATFMPQGIASPIGGLLADRFDRRKVFARMLLVQAAITAVLAVVLALGVREPAVLTLLILLASAAGALGQPSYSAMIPDLVPADEMVAMISLGIYSWNAGRIIGPLIGSVLVVSFGPAWTIAFNALTFVVMSIAVALVRRPFLPHGDGADGGVVERLVGGWRALRSTPGCFHALTFQFLLSVTIVPFMGLIPIYVKAEFDGGTGMTGFVSSAQGIGAIVGGVIVTMLALRHRRSDILVGIVGTLTAALLLYAVAPNISILAFAAAVLGAGNASAFITSSTVMQRDAPAASRGRVLSFSQASNGVSYGIGLMFIGSIADLTNLHVAFITGALLFPVGFFLMTRRSRAWRAAIDGPDARLSTGLHDVLVTEDA